MLLCFCWEKRSSLAQTRLDLDQFPDTCICVWSASVISQVYLPGQTGGVKWVVPLMESSWQHAGVQWCSSVWFGVNKWLVILWMTGLNMYVTRWLCHLPVSISSTSRLLHAERNTEENMSLPHGQTLRRTSDAEHWLFTEMAPRQNEVITLTQASLIQVVPCQQLHNRNINSKVKAFN